MFHQRRQHTISSTKSCERKKKELKITTVSQPSAIILKECKKVEVNDQDMKKYTDFTRQKNNNMKTIWRDTKKII